MNVFVQRFINTEAFIAQYVLIMVLSVDEMPHNVC